MDPGEIIEMILEGHLNEKQNISEIPGFRLDLQLNYSGLMAKKAYVEGYRRVKHKNRKKIGTFDFKIYNISTEIETPLVHPITIENAGEILNAEMIEYVFMGNDPLNFGGTPDETTMLQEVQLAMMEQEINWGDENFQAWTHFPPSRGKRQRDYFAAYLRRRLEEPNLLDNIKKTVAASGTLDTLPPPIGPEWDSFVKPPILNAKSWIDKQMLNKLREAAESFPDNPYHQKTYNP